MSRKKCTWQRARSAEQKSERENQILAAASALFAAEDFAEITLQKIARRAGFTRSNVYRYFSSREEIFLRLYRDRLLAWADAMDAALAELEPGAPAAVVADAWVSVTMRHRALLDLVPLLMTALERNSSEELIVANKQAIVARMHGLYAAVNRVLPDLTFPDGVSLVRTFHALVAGFWPEANPNPVLDGVLSRPEFAWMRLDFESTLRRALTLMIEGMLRDPNPEPRS